MDKRAKRALRRGIGQYGWALLLYYLLLNVVVSVVAEIVLVYEGFQAVIEGDSWQQFVIGMEQAVEEVFYGNGWGYLIACVLTVILIRLWKGKDFFGSIFEVKQDMTVRSFVGFLCVFFSGQLVFQFLAVIEELLLNMVGLSVMESVELASSGPDTFSMFLYMGLAAPLVEEIVFRGLLLRGLQPYGRRFAIFCSAVLFGLFHGNLVQSPYAFVVGLVLGYVAMEYSIVWAMVLHMMNNLVLGDVLMRLTAGLSPVVSDMIFLGIIGLSGIAGAVILIRSRKQIRAYRRGDPMDRQCLKAFCTAAPNVILFVITMLSALSMVLL